MEKRLYSEFKIRKLSSSAIAGIVLAVILAPLLLLAFLWRMGWIGNRELYATKIEVQGKTYTVKQLIDATKNFSHATGRDRFGVVYKAALPKKVTVAVKKLYPPSEQEISQIANEVYILKSLKHENLVELFGVYSKKNLHLLIYEYMEHNSIEQALHDPKATLDFHKWETRYDICLGIAKGLKYLHEDVKPRIIHRNITTSNILIDGTLKAKISDFGLAKFYELENSSITIGAGDTSVYMAPEYLKWKEITEKLDVYSYGVVLLQIVSGRKNAEHKPNQEAFFLLETAWVLHRKGRHEDLVDNKLFSDASYKREEAKTVLNLAMMCIEGSPNLRPTMSKIVSDLEEVKNKRNSDAASSSA